MLPGVILLGRLEVDILRDRTLWALGFVNALAMAFQHFGIKLTTATNSVPLVDIEVIFVALLAAAVLGERLERRHGAAMALGLAGGNHSHHRRRPRVGALRDPGGGPLGVPLRSPVGLLNLLPEENDDHSLMVATAVVVTSILSLVPMKLSSRGLLGGQHRSGQPML